MITLIVAPAMTSPSAQPSTAPVATLFMTPPVNASSGPHAASAAARPELISLVAAVADTSPSATAQALAPPVDEDAPAECARQRPLLGGMVNPACASLVARRSSPEPSPSETPAPRVSGFFTPKPEPPDPTQVVETACQQPRSVLASVNPLCLFKDVNEGLSKTIAEMTVWLASKIGEALEATGELDLTRAWFTSVFSSISSIAALIALIAVLLSVMAAALLRDPGEIMRTLLKVLTAGVSTGMVVIVVAKANQLIDAFCLYLLGPGGWKAVTDSLMVPATTLDNWIGMAAPLAPTGVMLLIAIGMILVFLVLWVEMLIRRLLLDVCVMMWPLVVSGAVWTGARPMTRRLMDSIISLELMKLIVVADFKMAANMLKNIDSVDEMTLALGLYWLAAVSPFMLMRLIGVVSGGLNPGGTGEGVREAVAGAAGAMLGRGRRLAGASARGLGSAGTMRAGGSTPMPAISGTKASADAGEKADGAQGDGERDPGKFNPRPIPAHLLKAFGIQPAVATDAGAKGGATPAAGDNGARPAGSKGAPAALPSSGAPLEGKVVGGGDRSTPPVAAGGPEAAPSPARPTPRVPASPAPTASTTPAGGSAPGGTAPTSRPFGTSGGRLPPPVPPPMQSDALPTYDDAPPPPPVALPPLPHQPELPDPDSPEPS
ncbi:hypothetical protein [Nonomuraea jabiensis]|uniref:hypothetical protein n=1 Tax=Nonomuraea jabiensis TaxID=882448 RepID=UPI003D7405EB